MPYIQGLTDFVPQIQEFNPDFNYFATALQSKQTKYDAGYNKVNSIYGSVMNAAMLRDDNNKNRDEFFKQADFNIKRIASLDLSKQENIDLASTVFKPFYEDQNMMKDIAFTRQYQNSLKKHENLKNCLDPKRCPGQAWDAGLQAINYKAQEFRNATPDEALSMRNVEYTPYINIMEKAQEVATKANLNVTQDRVSGNWIVKDKNGLLVEEPMRMLFIQNLGQDPDIQRMYDTKAYVERKTYANANAYRHANGVEGAEQEYITNMLKQLTISNHSEREKINNHEENVTASLSTFHEKNNREGLTENDLKAYETLKGQMNKLPDSKDQVKKNENTLSNINGIPLSALRDRVDMLVADNMKMSELMSAAKTFSFKDASSTREANPFALSAQNHQQALALEDKRYLHAKGLKLFEKELEKAEVKEQVEVPLIPMPNTVGTEANMLDNIKKGSQLEGLVDLVSSDAKQGAVSYDRNLSSKIELSNKNRDIKVSLIEQAYNSAVKMANNTYGKSSPMAKQYMEIINKGFGIKGGQEDAQLSEMIMKKLSSGELSTKNITDAYETTMNLLTQSRNVAADVGWAKSVFSENADVIEKLKFDTAAENIITHQQIEKNKKVINSIKTQEKDADLFMSATGYPLLGGRGGDKDFGELNIEEFKKRYAERHQYEPAYINQTYAKFTSTLKDAYGSDVSNQLIHDSADLTPEMQQAKYKNDPRKLKIVNHLTMMNNVVPRYVSESLTKGEMAAGIFFNPANLSKGHYIDKNGKTVTTLPLTGQDIERDSEAAYKNIAGKFLIAFDDQTQMSGTKANYYQAQSPVSPGSSLSSDTQATITNLINRRSENGLVVSSGVDVSKDSYESPLNENETAIALNLFANLNQDMGRTYKKDANNVPTFVPGYANVAAENPGLNALTISNVNPEALKKYKGTAKKPTIYDPIIEKLETEGLTLFFDKSKANNPFIKEQSPLDIVYQNGYNYHRESVGNIEVKQSQQNGYKISMNLNAFGESPTTKEFNLPLTTNPNEVHNMAVNLLKELEAYNKEASYVNAQQAKLHLKSKGIDLDARDSNGFFTQEMINAYHEFYRLHQTQQQ